MTNHSSNPVAETLLQVWKEQCRNARRYVVDGLKRKQERDRFRAEGAHFMLLSLKDQLASFPVFAGFVNELEADYRSFLNTLEQF